MTFDRDTAAEQLRAPLDKSKIKPPPKGKFGEYVEGLHVIREANRIFGEFGWSYRVTRLERTHYEIVELKGKDGPYSQLRTSYLCAVLVNVDGVEREGLAVGVGNGKPENAGDVIESAVKEAETDALKRALRTFGNTFGLALYEKDAALREVSDPEEEAARNKAIAEAIKLMDAATTGRELLDAAKKTNAVQGLPEVAAKRREVLDMLVKGAQSVAALGQFEAVFKPDWEHVKDAAAIRKDELSKTEGEN